MQITSSIMLNKTRGYRILHPVWLLLLSPCMFSLCGCMRDLHHGCRTKEDECSTLGCSLEVAKDNTNRCTVVVRLFNQANLPVYVSRYQIPNPESPPTHLEDFMSDAFAVRKKGELIPYKGFLAKYIVSTNSFVLLNPANVITSRIDLSKFYRFNMPGDYEVCYEPCLSFFYANISRASNGLPSKCEFQDLKSNSVKIRLTREDVTRIAKADYEMEEKERARHSTNEVIEESR